ncbi:hypothetical protein GGI07_001256 [Coemansia sp. Benny D115]|nr:hypothetical protein GGI07_001256 [Coemansia sp. Benny D115]
MELDSRIKSFKLEFPLKKSTSGLKPLRTYYGRIHIEVTEPVAISQLRLLFEGWERVDFGTKIGSARRLIFRSAEDLLLTTNIVVDTITKDTTFEFSCTMPNVNFPAAMRSTICEVGYTMSATFVGAARRSGDMATACANHIMALAADSVPVQVAPKVLPSGVGWLKPLVMRDGVMLTEPARRRFRRQTVQTAMNICVQVRNHCCTLGEAILVDVDATMLQHDRVLTFVRAAIIEQVALKTHARDVQSLEAVNNFLREQGRQQASTVVLAERTLNRKVSEIDPSALENLAAAKDWGTRAASTSSQIAGLSGVQNLRIRVPRRDVCTAEGFFLTFTHVLRLTFGLTSRPSNGRFDTKYATKDVPLRLVTSKFGDVGRMSQAEINKRLSALTTESDGSAVSAAYGYLLGENTRAHRPESLDQYAGRRDVPSPRMESLFNTEYRPYTPASECSTPQTLDHSIHTGGGGRARADSGYSDAPLSPLSPSTESRIVPLTPLPLCPAVPGPARRSLPPPPPPPQLVPKDGFQFGPLPPVPTEPPADKTEQITARPSQQSLAADNSDAPPERPLSAADSVLYIVHHQRDSTASSVNGDNNDRECKDEDEESSVDARNRDTLVELPACKPLPSASICSQSAAESDFCSARSHTSFMNGKEVVEEAMCDSELSSTQQASSIESSSLDDRRPGSDKRESSQSEGETVVYSPRSTHCALTDEEPETRGSSPMLKLPELPELPAIGTLGDLTKDLVASSSVFASEFSDFWAS